VVLRGRRFLISEVLLYTRNPGQNEPASGCRSHCSILGGMYLGIHHRNSTLHYRAPAPDDVKAFPPLELCRSSRQRRFTLHGTPQDVPCRGKCLLREPRYSSLQVAGGCAPIEAPAPECARCRLKSDEKSTTNHALYTHPRVCASVRSLGPLGFDFAQHRQTLRPSSSRDPQ